MRAVVWTMAALALAGCDRTVATPAVVTKTVVVERPAPATPDPQPVDEGLCEQIRSMRDINERLNEDGYADNYVSEYGSLLRANNCD